VIELYDEPVLLVHMCGVIPRARFDFSS